MPEAPIRAPGQVAGVAAANLRVAVAAVAVAVAVAHRRAAGAAVLPREAPVLAERLMQVAQARPRAAGAAPLLQVDAMANRRPERVRPHQVASHRRLAMARRQRPTSSLSVDLD